jgi:hypothetical protein
VSNSQETRGDILALLSLRDEPLAAIL